MATVGRNELPMMQKRGHSNRRTPPRCLADRKAIQVCGHSSGSNSIHTGLMSYEPFWCKASYFHATEI